MGREEVNVEEICESMQETVAKLSARVTELKATIAIADNSSWLTTRRQIMDLVETLRFIRNECDWEKGDQRIGPACTGAIERIEQKEHYDAREEFIRARGLPPILANEERLSQYAGAPVHSRYSDQGLILEVHGSDLEGALKAGNTLDQLVALFSEAEDCVTVLEFDNSAIAEPS